MTIESNNAKIERSAATVQDYQPMSVQHELQKEVLRESVGIGDLSIQKQLMQLLMSAQPIIQVQQTAQNQIAKGYLDIKV
ncbi:MAG: hypothetical protein KGZ71_10735 [Desulfobulbaceae bacterium]|nr:hypothetical protein [Candidatus Kapabacteria bacterium]MBS4000944.1 hypothetical protein [Desulfobulbaceae bacterium]